MAFFSVAEYLFTIVAFCLADGQPSSCNHGEYIPFADCTGYYHCVRGDPQPIYCPAELVFSNKWKVCVWPSDSNDCQEPITIEEQCENGATLIPHPSECQLYYNCSLRYVHVPRYFAQHMQECPYPQQFNTVTKQCDNFENVDCAERKEITYKCDYRSEKCSRSHCRPCWVDTPSCVNKSDGIHAHDGKPWTPYFATCHKQRTSSVDTCPRDTKGRIQLFHMDLEECVPLDMVPQEHGGTMPNCTGKEDGSYLDDVGRCNQYTVCRNGAVDNIVKCGDREVFDDLRGECWNYAKACGPCGRLGNW